MRRLAAAALTLASSLAWSQNLPADHSEWTIETGYLTKVKHNSPLDYRIVPTQWVWRSPAAFDIWKAENGTRLLFRHRLALVTETIPRGAEDYYIGFSGAPSFELWFPNEKTAMFYSIGGGAGYINAKGVEGGQGQHLTLNWFTQLGIRHQLSKNMGLSGSTYFVHHSNGGMTKPNPGIDALGYTIGLNFKFN